MIYNLYSYFSSIWPLSTEIINLHLFSKLTKKCLTFARWYFWFLSRCLLLNHSMFLAVGYTLFPSDNPIKNNCMGSSPGIRGPSFLSSEFATKFGGQPLLDHICRMGCSTILLKIVILVVLDLTMLIIKSL